jgi:hypothetical protein
VSQPAEARALAISVATFSSTSDESNGTLGVPTMSFSARCQYTVCAPRARISAARCTPLVATTTPGRPKTA